MIRVTASCNSNPSRPSVHVTPIITYVDKAVVDTEAPDAPTAVRTADVTETTAHVAWEAALDNVATTGYNVYVNGEKVNTELVTATEYDLTGLTPATDSNLRFKFLKYSILYISCCIRYVKDTILKAIYNSKGSRYRSTKRSDRRKSI